MSTIGRIVCCCSWGEGGERLALIAGNRSWDQLLSGEGYALDGMGNDLRIA